MHGNRKFSQMKTGKKDFEDAKKQLKEFLFCSNFIRAASEPENAPRFLVLEESTQDSVNRSIIAHEINSFIF